MQNYLKKYIKCDFVGGFWVEVFGVDLSFVVPCSIWPFIIGCFNLGLLQDTGFTSDIQNQNCQRYKKYKKYIGWGRSLVFFFFFFSVVCRTIIKFGTLTEVVLNSNLPNFGVSRTVFIQPGHVEMCPSFLQIADEFASKYWRVWSDVQCLTPTTTKKYGKGFLFQGFCKS